MSNRNRKKKTYSQNYQYSSFKEFDDGKEDFDLNNVSFIEKSKNKGRLGRNDHEIYVNIIDSGNKSKNKRLSISFRKDLMSNFVPAIQVGLVENPARLYFKVVSTEKGFVLSDAAGAKKRCYSRVPLDDGIVPKYEEYIGPHKLWYDQKHEAFYIEKEEGR